MGLTEQARSFLARQQPEHDIFRSAYTPEGTFTYDERILFFNLRYEVHTADGADAASTIGLREAEQFLRTLDLTHSALKVTTVNVSEIWNA